MPENEIKELVQSIYCTVEHGECFCEKTYMDRLITKTEKLLDNLKSFEIIVEDEE